MSTLKLHSMIVICKAQNRTADRCCRGETVSVQLDLPFSVCHRQLEVIPWTRDRQTEECVSSTNQLNGEVTWPPSHTHTHTSLCFQQLNLMCHPTCYSPAAIYGKTPVSFDLFYYIYIYIYCIYVYTTKWNVYKWSFLFSSQFCSTCLKYENSFRCPSVCRGPDRPHLAVNVKLGTRFLSSCDRPRHTHTHTFYITTKMLYSNPRGVKRSSCTRGHSCEWYALVSMKHYVHHVINVY